MNTVHKDKRINRIPDGLDFYILKSLKNTFDGKNAIERIYSKYNDEYNSCLLYTSRCV